MTQLEETALVGFHPVSAAPILAGALLMGTVSPLISDQVHVRPADEVK